MKNKFTSGVISGVLITALLGGVLFGSYVKHNEKAQPPLLVNDQQIKDGDTQIEDPESTQKFLSKVSTLEKLVDSYFLYEVDKEAYQDQMLKGLMYNLKDPYSCYYTPEEYAQQMEDTQGIYCGIGALVSQNIKTGVITIVKPFVDGPAYKAGLLPGDILVKVEDKDVTGIDVTDVVKDMKGEKGTNVKLTMFRESEGSTFDVVVTREEIEVPTVEYQMLDDKIGYIYVMQFDAVTVEQFINAVDTLEADGMQGLVIDMRDNPGGLYDAAVNMLDRIIEKGLLVYTKNKEGQRSESFAKTKESFDKPLAVLMNGNSASAAEIFAGAIQDYKAGIIVGTQSYGKGIVQTIIPLLDGSAVKMTIADYYTPNGRNIHKLGIHPDVEVELKDELKTKVTVSLEEDNQVQEAVKSIKAMINQ